MATTQEEFKQRFAAILLDLQESGSKDPEAMWLLGSLASEIAEKSGQPTWTSFKRTMAQDTYDRLLTDFQAEGNRQYKDGNTKKAYAIQVLAISLIAVTQDDHDLRPGSELLDRVIEASVAAYRASPGPKPGN